MAELAACRDRLVKSGVDIDGYNTVEIAADVVALREALGYDKWIVWGFSYGGRVAQEVLRQDPDGVAALVLDSPLTAAPRRPGCEDRQRQGIDCHPRCGVRCAAHMLLGDA